MSQQALMLFDPATGEPRPYPSHAAQYRDFHGTLAWLFNPWTGSTRIPADIGHDVFGHLILPLGEQLQAASPSNLAMEN